MDLLQETKEPYKKTFFNHVFSTTEEGYAELLNVSQYAILGVVPVIALNKMIQRFIPEADSEKSTLEITFEIFMQLIIMFCGVVVIHRIITYVPTYSGFKYDNLSLTNVILAFLIIVLSIQTKMGIKVNILVDRVYELWNGASSDRPANVKKSVRISNATGNVGGGHNSSQADYLDGGLQTDMFPPTPVSTSHSNNGTYDHMMRGGSQAMMEPAGPMAANSLLGSSFGFA
jgi:hypothetical protein